MKKAIIILTILSIISIGFGAYEGYLYIKSLNELNEATVAKTEVVDLNADLAIENSNLEEKYNQQKNTLLEENIGCKLWEKQEEVLKKIKE